VNEKLTMPETPNCKFSARQAMMSTAAKMRRFAA
jgi:hypothetical protein